MPLVLYNNLHRNPGCCKAMSPPTHPSVKDTKGPCFVKILFLQFYCLLIIHCGKLSCMPVRKGKTWPHVSNTDLLPISEILTLGQSQAKEQHAGAMYNASVPKQMLKKVLLCGTVALPWAVPSHEVAVKTLPHSSQTSVQVQPLLSQVVC